MAAVLPLGQRVHAALLAEGAPAARHGVPYGVLPRPILIHIMTEAVRTQSGHVTLGVTFTDWMRRMGFRTVSYGPRGSATLIKQQLDRLLACEWMIKWERDEAGQQKEFGVKEIKLMNEYVGTDRKSGNSPGSSNSRQLSSIIYVSTRFP